MAKQTFHNFHDIGRRIALHWGKNAENKSEDDIDDLAVRQGQGELHVLCALYKWLIDHREMQKLEQWVDRRRREQAERVDQKAEVASPISYAKERQVAGKWTTSASEVISDKALRELNARAQNILRRGEVTLYRQIDRDWLLEQRNCGERTARHILDWVKRHAPE